MKISQMKMVTGEIARASMKMGLIKELMEEARKQQNWKVVKELEEEIGNYKKFSLNFIGESGVGKTDGLIQLATELGIPIYMFWVGEFVDNGDLQGMPKVRLVNGREVTMNMLPHFYPQPKMERELDEEGNVVKEEVVYREDGSIMYDYEFNADVIENYADLYIKYEGNVNLAPGCIIFFDELNRAAAPDVKQGLFRTFERYAIGNYKFPHTSLLVTATNPNTSEYNVDNIMEEKAFKTRFVHMEVKGDNMELAKYFEGKNYNPSIVELIRQHPEDINPEGEAYDINITCTSRNLDFMNTIMDYTELYEKDKVLFSEIAAGVVNPHVATNLMSIMEAGAVRRVSGEEIVTNYDEVRSHILEAVESENGDSYLYDVKESFINFAMDEERVITFYENTEEEVENGKINLREYELNLCKFFKDLPDEFVALLIDEIAENKRLHPVFAEMEELCSIWENIIERYDGDAY